MAKYGNKYQRKFSLLEVYANLGSGFMLIISSGSNLDHFFAVYHCKKIVSFSSYI